MSIPKGGHQVWPALVNDFHHVHLGRDIRRNFCFEKRQPEVQRRIIRHPASSFLLVAWVAEVEVKWPPCFLRDWHPSGSLAFLREAPARVAPVSMLYPSASPPGFVISHLVSLPVPGMGREHLVRVWSVQGRAHGRDSVTGSGWHKCSWAGRGRTEHFLMGRYQRLLWLFSSKGAESC